VWFYRLHEHSQIILRNIRSGSQNNLADLNDYSLFIEGCDLSQFGRHHSRSQHVRIDFEGAAGVMEAASPHPNIFAVGRKLAVIGIGLRSFSGQTGRIRFVNAMAFGPFAELAWKEWSLGKKARRAQKSSSANE
jgi:hypothetical protein